MIFFLHPYRILIKLNGGKEGKGGVGTQEVSCFPSNSDWQQFTPVVLEKRNALPKMQAPHRSGSHSLMSR